MELPAQRQAADRSVRADPRADSGAQSHHHRRRVRPAPQARADHPRLHGPTRARSLHARRTALRKHHVRHRSPGRGQDAPALSDRPHVRHIRRCCGLPGRRRERRSISCAGSCSGRGSAKNRTRGRFIVGNTRLPTIIRSSGCKRRWATCRCASTTTSGPSKGRASTSTLTPDPSVKWLHSSPTAFRRSSATTSARRAKSRSERRLVTQNAKAIRKAAIGYNMITVAHEREQSRVEQSERTRRAGLCDDRGR